MISRVRPLFLVAILLLVLTTWAVAQDPAGPPPEARQPRGILAPSEPRAPRGTIHGPVNTDTSWMDTFEDEVGLTSMLDTALLDGDVRLSRIQALGHAPEGGAILAMTEASSGKIYLGTSGAYLNVYDPVAGTLTSLGAPVPDECFG